MIYRTWIFKIVLSKWYVVSKDPGNVILIPMHLKKHNIKIINTI